MVWRNIFLANNETLGSEIFEESDFQRYQTNKEANIPLGFVVGGIFFFWHCPSNRDLSLGQEERSEIDILIIIIKKLKHSRFQLYEAYDEQMVLPEQNK